MRFERGLGQVTTQARRRRLSGFQGVGHLRLRRERPAVARRLVSATAASFLLAMGVVAATPGMAGASTIPVGSDPWAVALNPAGTVAYVTNFSSGTVSVVNTSTGTVTATVTVGSEPWGVAVDPVLPVAFVANLGGGVSVVNTSTNTVTATIGAGAGPYGVAFNPAGTDAYVAYHPTGNF